MVRNVLNIAGVGKTNIEEEAPVILESAANKEKIHRSPSPISKLAILQEKTQISLGKIDPFCLPCPSAFTWIFETGFA